MLFYSVIIKDKKRILKAINGDLKSWEFREDSCRLVEGRGRQSTSSSWSMLVQGPLHNGTIERPEEEEEEEEEEEKDEDEEKEEKKNGRTSLDVGHTGEGKKGLVMRAHRADGFLESELGHLSLSDYQLYDQENKEQEERK
ncbi:hypothetical protein M0802_004219 [Mischocyttarus mexicanus]|nr:hypothetical protein M0802_004219 [Mischocyttarus mexicanus]